MTDTTECSDNGSLFMFSVIFSIHTVKCYSMESVVWSCDYPLVQLELCCNRGIKGQSNLCLRQHSI